MFLADLVLDAENSRALNTFLNVATATLSAVGLAIAGRAASHAKVARRDSRATREQVENDHDTNFREESDERHSEGVSMQTRIMNGITDVRQIVGRMDERLLRVEDRLDVVEDTQTRAEIEKARSRAALPGRRHRRMDDDI